MVMTRIVPSSRGAGVVDADLGSLGIINYFTISPPPCLLRKGPVTAEFVLLQEERKSEHAESDRPQQYIGVNVGQRGCLGNDGAVDHGIGDFAGLDGVGSGSDDAGGQSGGGVGERGRARTDISDEIDLMHLGAAGDDGGDHRCAHAAPDIAHEINQASDTAALFRRDTDEGHQVDWHEEKGKTDDLEHAEPGSAAKTNSELK